MDTGKIVLGTLGGIVAGAALGVLFAPAKGSVTRKRITSKGEEYADDVSEKFHQLMDSFERQFESVKADLLHNSENGKAKAAEATEAAAKAAPLK